MESGDQTESYAFFSLYMIDLLVCSLESGVCLLSSSERE